MCCWAAKAPPERPARLLSYLQAHSTRAQLLSTAPCRVRSLRANKERSPQPRVWTAPLWLQRQPLLHGSGFSTEDQRRFYLLLSGICKYNHTAGLVTGNEATGSPRSRVASRASPQQFLTKGFKDQAKAEESDEVYEVLTVKKRLEATHA